MIAIDSNILLRYLLNDDPEQSLKAAKIIQGQEKVLITDVVLVETIWTLKGKKYKLEKQAIIDVLHALFAEPNLFFEDNQTVWKAMSDYANAKQIKVGSKWKSADFPDALIVNKANLLAKTLKQSMEGVYTFDVAAQALKGTVKA